MGQRRQYENRTPIVNPEARYGTSSVSVMPGPGGGHVWPPWSYVPTAGLVYIPSTIGGAYTYQADPNFTPRPVEIGPTGRGQMNMGTGNGGGRSKAASPCRSWSRRWSRRGGSSSGRRSSGRRSGCSRTWWWRSTRWRSGRRASGRSTAGGWRSGWGSWWRTRSSSAGCAGNRSDRSREYSGGGDPIARKRNGEDWPPASIKAAACLPQEISSFKREQPSPGVSRRHW